jgi:hypothetical protein
VHRMPKKSGFVLRAQYRTGTYVQRHGTMYRIAPALRAA